MRAAHIKLNYIANLYQYLVPDNIKKQDKVIVRTTHGLEYGSIVSTFETSKDVDKYSAIERVVSDKDLKTIQDVQTKEIELKKGINELLETLKMDMQIEGVHLSFDSSYVYIQFYADQRVDFRDLVKEISSKYHARVELKQIGPRDIAKIKGGIGPCGLMLCCTSFIGEFDAISIKMAKNQSLSLNPQNISGLCGKLLCCLKYEDETYSYLKQQMPQYGDTITTNNSKGRVIDVNYISKKAKVKYQDGHIDWISLGDQTA